MNILATFKDKPATLQAMITLCGNHIQRPNLLRCAGKCRTRVACWHLELAQEGE